mgnify:CR=1 FL=1
MKRIALWLLSTVSALVLLFGYHTSTSGPESQSQGTVFTSTLPAGSTADTSSKRSVGSGTGGGGRSVTATGAVADTRWGPVQVQLTSRGGTITKVSVLQHPTGNSTSDDINNYALPILVRDTLDAQGTDIHMVSGATYTSTGYVQSLQSALDRAGL